MSESFVIENRVRGGKVVLVSVPEAKYNSTMDVYRNCATIEEATWVRKQIEEHKIDAQTAADSVIYMEKPFPVKTVGDVIKAKVKAKSPKAANKKAKSSLKKDVLAYLDSLDYLAVSHMPSMVNMVSAEFNITKANARYYITRVWKGNQ